jgi:hypothetical protein
MVGLDHNHSHFILVEDEVEGAEIALRGEFEKCLQTLGTTFAQHTFKSDEEEEQHPVPIVSICGTEPFP